MSHATTFLTLTSCSMQTERTGLTHNTYRIVCQSMVSVIEWLLRAVNVRLRHSLTGHDVGTVHLPSIQLTPCNTPVNFHLLNHATVTNP